jgi:FkbM family methyltransferase
MTEVKYIVPIFKTIKASVLSALSSNPTLLSWIRRIYCSIGIGTRTERDFLFALARKQKKDVFVLQVGANDGVSNDAVYPFIRKHGWKGLLLEPLPDVFEKLKQNYLDNDGVILCNAAMAHQDGVMTFYRVAAGDHLPEWCDRVGSFLKEAVLSHKNRLPTIEDFIVEQKIEALSFRTLVARHSVKKIDVIMIDAEGYDFEILKQIDFHSFRPKLVIYEIIHLSDDAKKASVELLNRAGYKVHNSYNMNYVGVPM